MYIETVFRKNILHCIGRHKGRILIDEVEGYGYFSC
ncbi:hypothetical protein CNEONATNEC86_03749 [Clostridium neonatale]|nr:hypothetical protein CNEONATNEC86_03749 [Clostridium neonatale]